MTSFLKEDLVSTYAHVAYVHQPGIELMPLHWKHGVLKTGSQEVPKVGIKL